MACKRSAVRSRLAPPGSGEAGSPAFSFSIKRPVVTRPHRLVGLGHHPFKVATRVRIPLGTPIPCRRMAKPGAGARSAPLAGPPIRIKYANSRRLNSAGRGRTSAGTESLNRNSNTVIAIMTLGTCHPVIPVIAVMEFQQFNLKAVTDRRPRSHP